MCSVSLFSDFCIHAFLLVIVFNAGLWRCNIGRQLLIFTTSFNEGNWNDLLANFVQEILQSANLPNSGMQEFELHQQPIFQQRHHLHPIW